MLGGTSWGGEPGRWRLREDDDEPVVIGSLKRKREGCEVVYGLVSWGVGAEMVGLSSDGGWISEGELESDMVMRFGEEGSLESSLVGHAVFARMSFFMVCHAALRW